MKDFKRWVLSISVLLVVMDGKTQFKKSFLTTERWQPKNIIYFSFSDRRQQLCWMRPGCWLSLCWCPSSTCCFPACSTLQPGWRTMTRLLCALMLPLPGTSSALWTGRSKFTDVRVKEHAELMVLVVCCLVSRNLMLKVSVLGVLCNHWLLNVTADSKLTVT